MASERDINLAIIGEDATKPATDGAARNFDKLQRKVDSFSSSKPSAEMQRFSKVIDSSVRDGESAFTSINRSIEETRTKITKLRNDFRTTGSSSVFGDLKGAQKDLKALLSVAGELSGAGEQAGTSFAQSFSKSASSILPEVLSNPVGLAIAAGVVIVATPVITAAVAAAVSAGVGFGFIGAAALIEKNNPGIQAAIGGLGKDAGGVLRGAAAPLVQPFIEAINSIDALVKNEAPELKAAFTAVAPAVGLIVKGLSSLTADLLPALVSDSKAFTEALQDPTTQNALGAMSRQFTELFKVIGNNPQLVADGFKAIAYTVDGLLMPINALLSTVGAVDKAAHKVGQGTPPVLSQAKAAQGSASGTGSFLGAVNQANGSSNAVQNLGIATSKAAASLQTYEFNQQRANMAAAGGGLIFQKAAGVISTYASQMENAATEARILNGALLSVDMQSNTFDVGLKSFTKSLKDSKDAFLGNSDAALANQGQLLSLISVAQNGITVNEANGDSVDTATKKYNAQLETIERSVTGNSKNDKAIRAMIDSLKAIPPTTDATVNLKVNGFGSLNRALTGLAQVGAGGHAAFGASDGGFMPGSGRTNEPARQFQPIDLTNNVFVDGEFATRRAQRVVAMNNRRVKVGVRA